MGETKLSTRELDRIASRLNLNREAVLRRMAFDIAGRAAAKARIDTGAMANSVYVVTVKEDHYQEQLAAAMRRNAKIKAEPHPAPAGKWFARVGPSVDYAAYVELGTSRARAQPFLGPAAEEVSRRFNDGTEWKELVT